MMAGLRRARRGRDPQAGGADRRLPAAGRPHPRRPHACSTKRRAPSASCSAMKAEMHALEERLGDASIPEAEHDAMLAPLQRPAGPLPRCTTATASSCKTATVLQGLGFKTGRLRAAAPRRSPAAGRCASRWPSCCSASPTCCCSTSRPTTSTSRRATGSRSTSTRYPLRRHPRLARPLLPRRGRHAHRRPRRCAR